MDPEQSHLAAEDSASWVLNSATGIDKVALLRCQGQDCGYIFIGFAVQAVFCKECVGNELQARVCKVGALKRTEGLWFNRRCTW